ncbi:hypothetical protein G9A89_017812 [Geosiphon pyriformis]|nr:hypothetical protein G9A89_017812 [Geosiphon pyriformis]
MEAIHMQDLTANQSFQAPFPSRKYHFFLFLASFVLSNNNYSNVSRRTRPLFAKLRINLPDQTEYIHVTSRKHHDHSTPLRALVCLNDECFPDDTRRGVKVFLQVYAFVLTLQSLWNLPGQLRRSDNLRKIYKGLSWAGSRQIAIAAASYVVLYKVLLRFFRRLFDSLFRPAYIRTYTETIYDNALQFLKLPPLREYYEYLFQSSFVPPFFAGALAGSTIFFLKHKEQRVSLSTYLLIKSLQFAYQSMRENRLIPQMPRWCGSWMLFPITSAQLIYAHLVNPDTFPESYGRFIASRSTTYIQPRPINYPEFLPWPTGRDIIDSIRILGDLHYPEFNSPQLHPYSSSLPNELGPINPILALAHPGHTRTMCAMLHPDELSCLLNFSKFVAKEGAATLKFLGMINFLSLVLRWKQVRERPYETMRHFLNHSVPLFFKGGTCITMALATSWGLICGFQKIFPNNFIPVSRIYLNGLIGGLWIFAEDPHRRLDIGIYSLRLSVESMWKLLVKKGVIKPIRGGEVLIFSFGMGILMSIFQTQPRNISSLYIRYCLKKLIGSENPSA